MTLEVSKDVKEEIFKLISIPGIEIEDIAKKVNLDQETVMKVLSDEYFRTDLTHGRRLCCRF